MVKIFLDFSDFGQGYLRVWSKVARRLYLVKRISYCWVER